MPPPFPPLYAGAAWPYFSAFTRSLKTRPRSMKLANRSKEVLAGDSRTKLLRQIVTAVADGAVAAMQAERFLHG